MASDSARQLLRRQLRGLRRGLPPETRTAAVAAINQRLIASDFFRRARTIALYAAFDGEPELAETMAAALRLRKQVFLPVLPNNPNAALRFARLEHPRRMRKNSFGIGEPVASAAGFIPPSALDLVITPVVGFDSNGNRLGMGGGYYDRTFAFVAKHRQVHTPRLVGVAFEIQRLDTIAAEAWDVPLWRIATEANLYKTDTDTTEN